MASVKRKYIEATYDILANEGLQGVSIRKVADLIGCSSAALYKHFPDIDDLIAVASVRFLHDYSNDARILSKVDLNPLELNLQLWECLAYYSFVNAPILENLFFGKGNRGAVQNAILDYYEAFPEEIESMRGYMITLLKGDTIMERDMILPQRAAEAGMISMESASYLCKVDTYLFQGMLASVRYTYDQPGVARETTREFMRLIIRNYTSQLLPGYTILVCKPEKPSLALDRHEAGMNSYRCVLSDELSA
ncbi:MAG: TetR/AcrR family transcriptional regulator [Actinobacteria bacterium]|nr:TetR/AcrR family transcriptional regulator [Actinomycetota bacterium]